MSSSFAFVPRKVAKSTKPATQTSANTQTRILPPTPSTSSSSHIEQNLNVVDKKGKAKANDKTDEDDDYAILISLALSNHAIWSDPELRRVLEWNNEGCKSISRPYFLEKFDWFYNSVVPLSHLLRHSSVISSSGKHLELEPEAAIVKALRRDASAVVDVRVLVSQPSKSDWFQKDRNNRKESVGGYEIRRKDWNSEVRPDRDYTKSDWDERTVYMVRRF
jgi:hypothetical protein